MDRVDLLADEAATCDSLDSPFLADTFADWVYGQVMSRAGHCLPRGASNATVESATVSTVLTTALQAAQQQRNAEAAYMLRELVRRFESRGR